MDHENDIAIEIEYVVAEATERGFVEYDRIYAANDEEAEKLAEQKYNDNHPLHNHWWLLQLDWFLLRRDATGKYIAIDRKKQGEKNGNDHN